MPVLYFLYDITLLGALIIV